MKEIQIIGRIIEDKIASAIKTRGFDNNIEKVLLLIGILENLKQEQLKKLETLRKEI